MEGICESHFSREYNTDVINHCCSRCGEFIYQEVVGNRWQLHINQHNNNTFYMKEDN